jgi:Ni/Fe-hydrogenase 1 B-type cytochrome subunit
MSARPQLEPVYVWDRVLRLVHWTLALTIVTLSATGIAIAHPFVDAPHAMRWIRLVHFIAAIAFSMAILLRMVWLFAGPRVETWRELVPTTRARIRELRQTIRFYLWPKGEAPAHFGHNPLAGLSYVAFYSMCLALVGTGLALWSSSAAIGTPARIFTFLVPLMGGLAIARFLHHVLMWGVLLFAIVHIYLAVFNATVARSGLLDSIVTGWKILKDGGREHGR